MKKWVSWSALREAPQPWLWPGRPASWKELKPVRWVGWWPRTIWPLATENLGVVVEEDAGKTSSVKDSTKAAKLARIARVNLTKTTVSRRPALGLGGGELVDQSVIDVCRWHSLPYDC